MTLPDRLVQPGPERVERVLSVETRSTAFEAVLPAGSTLLDAVGEAFACHGLRGGVAELSGGGFGPFVYLTPALSDDPRHAAYYGGPFEPALPVRLERANLTFGEKDGAPFLHCHAVWFEAGRRVGGHVVPWETTVAGDIAMTAFGSADATFRVEPDRETNFALLTPGRVEAAIRPLEGPRVALVKLQPNEEIGEALEFVCRKHGFAAARLRGSIGSLVGATFDEGPPLDSIASELFVREGTASPGGTRIEIEIVGVDGTIRRGVLAPGVNPVCITFEGWLEEIAAD